MEAVERRYLTESLRQSGGETQFDIVMHIAAQILENNRVSMLRYKMA